MQNNVDLLERLRIKVYTSQMFLEHDVIVEGQVAVALQVAQLVIFKLATILGAVMFNKIIVVCCCKPSSSVSIFYLTSKQWSIS